MTSRAKPAARHRPRFIPPQLATLVDQVPTGDDWIHEVKYDGYRIVAVVEQGKARLVSRNGKDWTGQFPAIAAALGRAPDGVVDGEVVALDKKGRSSFQLLQQRGLVAAAPPLVYVTFDLLQRGSADLREESLDRRRRELESYLGAAGLGKPGGIVRVSEAVGGSGSAVLTRACRRGLEGVISKQRTAPYQSGRSRAWLKIKCGRRQEFIVVGYTPPQRSRVAIGSLLLAVREKGRLQYAGRVGTGMTVALLRDLLRRLEPRVRRTTPLPETPKGLPTGVRWVTPTLVVEVAFTEWTVDGRLRHPSLIALREDKPATAVRRETPVRQS